MSGPDFFQTPMGRKFFEADVPRLLKTLSRIADALELQPPTVSNALKGSGAPCPCGEIPLGEPQVCTFPPPPKLTPQQLKNLLERAAAALENDTALSQQDMCYLIKDLMAAAKEMDDGS
jgi:hypothetical protein